MHFYTPLLIVTFLPTIVKVFHFLSDASELRVYADEGNCLGFATGTTDDHLSQMIHSVTNG